MSRSWIFTFLFIFTYLLSFAQIESDILVMNSDFNWTQLQTNVNIVYCIGFNKDKLVYQDIMSGIREEIYNVNNSNNVILIDYKLFICPLVQNNKTNDSSYDVLAYDLNEGKLIDKLSFHQTQKIIQYRTDGEYKNVFYSTIDLESYMSGLTDGRLKGKIYELGNSIEIMDFSHEQDSPPNRIGLPIFAKCGEITVLAFDSEYILSIYEGNGKKIKNFTNPNFTNKPYTEEEISFLTPLQQSVIGEGKTYPPVIQKIEILANYNIVITRHSRPNSNNIVVDVFNVDGKLLDTFVLGKDKNEKLIDSIVLSNNKYFALFRSEESIFSLKQYILVNR